MTDCIQRVNGRLTEAIDLINSVPVYCCCGGSLAASVACSWALPCCCIKVP